MRKRQNRNRRWIIGVSILALAVGSVAALEWGLSYRFGLGDPVLYETHDSFGYAYQPDQSVTRRGNLMQTNRHGMRAQDFAEEPAPGENRILLFGDEILTGISRIDQTELAAVQLRALMESDGDELTVATVGAPGWRVGNMAGHAERQGFFGAHTVVVVMDSDGLVEGYDFGNIRPVQHPTEGLRSAIHEAVTRYAIPRYAPWLQSHDCSPGPPPENADDPEIEVPRPEEALSRLVTAVRDAGVQTMQIGIWPIHAEVLDPGQSSGAERIREYCRQMDLECFSFLPSIDARAEASESFYQDTRNPNAAGHRLIAEVLVQRLATGEPE